MAEHQRLEPTASGASDLPKGSDELLAFWAAVARPLRSRHRAIAWLGRVW